MAPTDAVIWLRERTALGILSEPARNARKSAEEQVIPAGSRSLVEDTPPAGLYF